MGDRLIILVDIRRAMATTMAVRHAPVLRVAARTCHLLTMPAAGRRDSLTIQTGTAAISRDLRHLVAQAAILLMLREDTLHMDTEPVAQLLVDTITAMATPTMERQAMDTDRLAVVAVDGQAIRLMMQV